MKNNKILVNLTLPTVLQEIDTLLERYPNNLYQKLLIADSFRLDLAAYVLSHVPNQYKAIETPQAESSDFAISCHSSEQLVLIERWIQKGISELLHQRYGDRMRRSVAQAELQN